MTDCWISLGTASRWALIDIEARRIARSIMEEAIARYVQTTGCRP